MAHIHPHLIPCACLLQEEAIEPAPNAREPREEGQEGFGLLV